MNQDIDISFNYKVDGLLAIGVGLISLILYIRTLAPSLLWGDSAEFQTLSYTLGMTHPSGYMTQVMLGKLFTYIPVENIAFRVNLMSAVFASLAVSNTYLIVRLLGGVRIAGISSSLFLMLTEGFWWRALIAESYAPAAGMVSTIWLLVFLWGRTKKWIFLFLAGILGGLSVGIHSTIIMSASSVLLMMILLARKKVDWGAAIIGAIVGLFLTISFFFILDANDPPSSIYNTVYRPNLSVFHLSVNEFDNPLERFFVIFPASHFWSYYFTAHSEEVFRRFSEFIYYFPIWVLILILLGIIMPFLKKNWHEGLYPLITFIVIWTFALTVSFSIYREFYVPIWPIIYVWFGLGASFINQLLIYFIKRNQTIFKALRGFLILVLILSPIWNSRRDLINSILLGFPTFVQHNHIYSLYGSDKAFRDATKILRKIEYDAIVFTNWDKLYSLVYTAHIENGITSISFHEWLTNDPNLTESTIRYIDENIDNRPIYFVIIIPELPETFRLEKINDELYRVYRK
jgi:hypothetical protein